MNNFSIYFQIGFEHIMNLGALDHILFMAALALRYDFSEWKRLLMLVTAFTIGHSITLALAVFNIIHFPKNWIELFIALTIIIAVMYNLIAKKTNHSSKITFIYFFTLCFGLIHGMGFANEFVALEGKSIGTAFNILFANVGIEIAQLIFATTVLIISFICLSVFKLKQREYSLFSNGIIFGLALQMVLARLPF
jgi:hypothetical protein